MPIKINEEAVRIMAAITAGVYAGNLEAKGEAFTALDEFGADSFQHIEDYIDIGRNLRLEFLDDGRVDTEAFRNSIYEAVREKFVD